MPEWYPGAGRAPVSELRVSGPNPAVTQIELGLIPAPIAVVTIAAVENAGIALNAVFNTIGTDIRRDCGVERVLLGELMGAYSQPNARECAAERPRPPGGSR